MNLFNIFGLIVTINIYLSAQYDVKSAYLLNPELNIGYVDSCANFWLKSYDNANGGFFTNVNRQGNVNGPNKNMLTQSRNAYGMVRAFMLTGNIDYLTKAKNTLDFMYETAWDDENGGWFGQIKNDGTPENITSNKTAFDQHYALLGIIAYFEATADTTAWRWFEKGFQKNENDLWHSDENRYGYFDHVDYNWVNKHGKSFNATVDAVTTHLLNAYLLTNDDMFKEKLIKVADNIVNRLASTLDSYKIGFVENFNTDWTWSDGGANYNRRTIMGHVLKSAWVLGRIYQLIPDDKYINSAEKLALDVWENGYDHQYGAPYKDYDRVTGEMYFYGQDTAKAWWQVEQAIMAGLELYDITNNEIYLEMADGSLNFFMKYFVDHTYGDIFADLYKNGSLIPAWGTQKGNGYKAAYHSIETGYYSYLYGSAFYNNAPITLYYNIESFNVYREILLNPLAINEHLSISSVELDGLEYTNYTPNTKLINIAAGTGGVFKVVFEKDIAISVDDKILRNSFELSQNYPNPFNPTTNIAYSVSSNDGNGKNVKLQVFDMLGNKITTLVNETQKSGKYIVKFDASNLSSGIYFYRLDVDNVSASKKMMLLK